MIEAALSTVLILLAALVVGAGAAWAALYVDDTLTVWRGDD